MDLVRDLNWANAQFRQSKDFRTRQTLAWERVLRLQSFFGDLGYDFDDVVDTVRTSKPKKLEELRSIEPFDQLDAEHCRTMLPVICSEAKLKIRH
ncbi:MAG: hypothetical protein C9356_11880 [Oleiphilus sp.]|nr:MAG: hypothetical protein C9356_11880 [Oleiphilus sp.]